MWSKEHIRPYVVLNRDRGAAARLRMSLAHELGHVILHRNYSSKGSGADELSKTLDDQAFAFAQAFLLPEDSFLRDVYSTSLDSFVGLKQKWKVAISAMLYRLRKLGMFSDAKYRSLMMQITKRRWRTSEPFDDEWAPEEPILLKQALQVIVDHGLQDAERLEQDTQIETQIIQRLANLPATFFAPKAPDNLITFRAPR
jgi:Zn-dependent peptidase ImmA (M78 family)